MGSDALPEAPPAPERLDHGLHGPQRAGANPNAMATFPGIYGMGSLRPAFSRPHHHPGWWTAGFHPTNTPQPPGLIAQIKDLRAPESPGQHPTAPAYAGSKKPRNAVFAGL